jgi:hypothetical protein
MDIADWVSDPDNLTAISLFIVAVFTIVLTVVSIVQARLTKRAILVTQRALLDLERAHIVPAFPKSVEQAADEWHVHVSFSNIGRSFGVVKSVSAAFAAPDALPKKPPKKDYEERAADAILRPGDDWSDAVSFKMPGKQEGQIVYGYIRYEDIFGRTWRHRFACAVWSEQKPGRDFFQIVGGDAYNAETEE